jgi:hypothetical protein
MKKLWRNLKLYVHAMRVGWKSGRASMRLVLSTTKMRWQVDEMYEKVKSQGLDL